LFPVAERRVKNLYVLFLNVFTAFLVKNDPSFPSESRMRKDPISIRTFATATADAVDADESISFFELVVSLWGIKVSL